MCDVKMNITKFPLLTNFNVIDYRYKTRKEGIEMVGMRISQLRKTRNMTQRELARALNVSPSAIGMYEQGRRQPSADLIVAICREFSVSTQWLLTGRPYSTRDFQEDLRMLLSAPTGELLPDEGRASLTLLLQKMGDAAAEQVNI